MVRTTGRQTADLAWLINEHLNQHETEWKRKRERVGIEERLREEAERTRLELEAQLQRMGIQPRPPSIQTTVSDSISWVIDDIESKKDNVPKPKPKIKYTPGMKLDDFIEKVLKEEGINPMRRKWLQVYQRCILPEDVKCTIEEAIVTTLESKKYEEWGLDETFEKGITNSILLYGPPGTGKTMVAESIAAILDKNLMKLTSGDIQSQIPGQAERNMSESFQKAEKNNCVIMFDECDSLLYNRDSVGMIMASEINHLLGLIENFKGVVILTTNRLGWLDPALQRRIIAKVKLPLPNRDQRIQIWNSLMPKKVPLEKNVMLENLADYKLSGGEIKNAILLAMRKAIATNSKMVTMDHLELGAQSVIKAKKDYEEHRPNPYGHQQVIQVGKTRDKGLDRYWNRDVITN